MLLVLKNLLLQLIMGFCGDGQFNRPIELGRGVGFTGINAHEQIEKYVL